MNSEGSDQLSSEQKEDRNASVLTYKREISNVCDHAKGQVKRKGEKAVPSNFYMSGILFPIVTCDKDWLS